MKAAVAFVATALLFYFIAFRALEWLLPFKYVGDPADVDLRGVGEDIHFLKVAAFSIVAAVVGGIAAACVATVPRNRWRFSLKTLLIATTLIAVGLGIIVWMLRAG